MLTLNDSKTKSMPIVLRDSTGMLYDRLKVHSCGIYTGRNCLCEVIERVDSYKYV